MLDKNYWQRLNERRLNRRRFLTGIALGGAGVTAAAVVGCGDEESGTGGTQPGGTYVDPGISDTEIRIGSVLPLSGPISPGIVDGLGPTLAASFDYVNAEEDGVNGRRIKFILYDGAYEAPKTLDQIRRLVEEDRVFALHFVLGTPMNQVIAPYLAQNKVPNLSIGTGAEMFHDTTAFPLVTQTLSYINDWKLMGAHVAKEKPGAKIAAIRQSGDVGDSSLKGFKIGLKFGGGNDAQIVSDSKFENSDITLNAQVIQAKDSGATILAMMSAQRPTALAVKAMQELGYKTDFLLLSTNGGNALATIKLFGGGADRAVGAISVFTQKDPSDPEWKDDPAVKKNRQIIGKYGPSVNLEDPFSVQGAVSAKILIRHLEDMKEPTREGLLKAARSVKNFNADNLLLPGVTYNAQEGSNVLALKARYARFDGTRWVQFGDVVDSTKIV